MGSVIRPATLHDLDALLELEQAFPGDRITRSSFRHLLTKAHADVFVFEQDGKLLGNAVVLYRKGFHGARLYSVVVDPQARGQGVGAALLEQVENAAVRQRCVSIRLEVREDNAPAIRLYERHGYSVVGRTADYYQDHSAALRMSKRLLPTKPPTLLPIPYYPQTLDFTCGSAVLMMAMAYLGFKEPLTRTLELQLWREATTIFMMSGHGGSSAHGLALAAMRRGFDATVLERDDSVPFMDTVRSEEKKRVIAESHVTFLKEFGERGGETVVKDFGVSDVVAALDRKTVPLVLLSGYRFYGEKLPHWMVFTGYDEHFLYLHDPFIPEGAQRADGVYLPLARRDFERMSRFGKARHRYMVIISTRD
jgi:ribosomal-protein-alanine acetyltransferase